jgi:hypothetical protein
MSTWLASLRALFWTLPLQRWCTVVGALMMVIGLAPLLLRQFVGDGYLVLSSARLWWLTMGQLVLFGIPMLLGGAMWRALSAPRRIGLAPYGRLRLLSAAFGIAVMAAVFLIGSYMLLILSMWSATRLPGGEVVVKMPSLTLGSLRFHMVNPVSAFATATWWAIASFIASRSPLATLLVVLAAIGGYFALDKLGFDNTSQLWMRPWSIALPLALWAMFGAWYLRTRRIAPPGWLLPGGQSVLASVALPESSATSLARHAALERLLLGGASVSRILVQWLIVGGMLLFLLTVIAWQDEGQRVIAAHMAFAALIACPAIVAVQSMAIVQRARSLWLASGCTRSELFAFTERTVLKFALGMSMLFASFMLLLWFTQPWRPTLTLVEVALVVVLPSLQLATHSLTASRGGDFYWRWPVVILLCWFIAWKPLTATDPVSWIGPRGWLWYVLAAIATASFHLLARRRWLGGDFPRVAAAT